MSNLPTQSEAFFDSDELMSWLLLNPEIVDYDESMPTLAGDGCGGDASDGTENYGTEGNNGNDEDVKNPIGFKQEVSSPFAGGMRIKVRPTARRKAPAVKSKGKPETQANRSPKIGKKRQRESIEDIEARVNELRSENADLQAHLMNVTQRTTEVQKQRMAMEKLMVSKLAEINSDEDCDQSELSKVVKQYTDIYADYGKCRQREVSFHLNQLEKLLCPTKTTKLSLWALQQDKSFFQTSKSPMFEILSKELELTPEQTEKIQERREKTQHLLGQLKESLSLIGTLKTAIEKKHACYDGICGRVQEAATPKQTVLFLRWISAHAEELAKHIPAFSRSVHHMPNVEFVESVVNTNGGGSGSSNASGNHTNNSHTTSSSSSGTVPMHVPVHTPGIGSSGRSAGSVASGGTRSSARTPV
mmetsp:Transcript_79746/g.156388  ORF Transcript_79746/g.156388 Transcript_79746/m.156388 type:complete len:416 (+) Transcript_79746:48-1295(+)|eukprot:CAMPEP_0170368680 /NCGR_PEP_ID=MMETSP0117_2-20130122/7581_1 /TAXON_ID=400756 /ORGANISM="Durinskia baltica, Strain CSIRO CS-38" /LENGTH=415 /DNA_ID=CAMNT_0010623353 /DNA_START=44 /DNA_END=1291 /DNA_ORIENTATION=-